MSTPFVGEIRLFAGTFAIDGWAFCDGSLRSISENEVLFALIGTTYGGDGVNTFALPDLRGRVPIHQGPGPGLSNRVMGETGGAETVALTINQYPAHRHALAASTAIGTAAPAGGVLAASSANVYGSAAPSVAMAAQAIGPTPGGAAQPHNNMAPSLGLNYIISLFGIFPSQA
jgi:microcystin-dependent protein